MPTPNWKTVILVNLGFIAVAATAIALHRDRPRRDARLVTVELNNQTADKIAYAFIDADVLQRPLIARPHSSVKEDSVPVGVRARVYVKDAGATDRRMVNDVPIEDTTRFTINP